MKNLKNKKLVYFENIIDKKILYIKKLNILNEKGIIKTDPEFWRIYILCLEDLKKELQKENHEP
jgi:hypothetical protein